jgi:hypothetical protein
MGEAGVRLLITGGLRVSWVLGCSSRGAASTGAASSGANSRGAASIGLA